LPQRRVHGGELPAHFSETSRGTVPFVSSP
jgi:hypothetical protein